jgi:hypothetical protein
VLTFDHSTNILLNGAPNTMQIPGEVRNMRLAGVVKSPDSSLAAQWQAGVCRTTHLHSVNIQAERDFPGHITAKGELQPSVGAR